MATKSIYDICIAYRRQIGEVNFHTGSYKPSMKKLFGRKKLVTKCEFERCSESEKRRHLYEDRTLIAFYLDSHPDFHLLINNTYVMAVQ